MRVMICYYFFDNAISLGEDLALGFESLGHSVNRFDSSSTQKCKKLWKTAKSLGKLVGLKSRVSSLHEKWISSDLSSRFIDSANKFCPELIVVINGERVKADVVQLTALKCRARSVLWWVKPPRWQASIFEDKPYYNKVFTIDGSVSDPSIGHLPSWALNDHWFFPGNFSEKNRELLFIGTWSPLRQSYLEAIADLPLRIIGKSWGKRLPIMHPLRSKVINRWVSGTELANEYRNALAVIDIPQFEQSQSQGVNMRFADVPACGTVLITPKTNELEQWFTDGKDALSYTDLTSLRFQCTLVLENKDLANVISLSASNSAQKLPTFSDRAIELMQS
jgi:hypothetical protein